MHSSVFGLGSDPAQLLESQVMVVVKVNTTNMKRRVKQMKITETR